MHLYLSLTIRSDERIVILVERKNVTGVSREATNVLENIRGNWTIDFITIFVKVGWSYQVFKLLSIIIHLLKRQYPSLNL